MHTQKSVRQTRWMLVAATAGVIAASVLSRSASADVVDWTNGTSDSLWATAGNWFNEATATNVLPNPATFDTLVFGDNAGALTTDQSIKTGAFRSIPGALAQPANATFNSALNYTFDNEGDFTRGMVFLHPGNAGVVPSAINLAGNGNVTFLGPVYFTNAFNNAYPGSAGTSVMCDVSGSGTGTIKFVGGVYSGNSGTSLGWLSLGNAGSFNGILDIQGSDFVVQQVANLGATAAVTNTGATTRTMTFNTDVNVTLALGVAGNLNFNKGGTGNLTFADTTKTFSGTATVGSTAVTPAAGNTLTLSGNGILPNAAGVAVIPYGNFVEDNTATNNTNRFSNTGGITLNSGTYRLIGNAAASSAEVIGALHVNGASFVDIRSVGGGLTSTFTPTSLVRDGTMAMVDFIGNSGGFALGTDTFIKFNPTSPVVTSGDKIGGWAIANNTEWAIYDNTNGVLPLATYDADINVLGTGDVKLSTLGAVQITPAGPATVSRASLNLVGANSIDLNGNNLALSHGGILSQGVNSISDVLGGGKLSTPGTTTPLAVWLGANATTTTIDANIESNGLMLGSTSQTAGRKLVLNGTLTNTGAGEFEIGLNVGLLKYNSTSNATINTPIQGLYSTNNIAIEVNRGQLTLTNPNSTFRANEGGEATGVIPFGDNIFVNGGTLRLAPTGTMTTGATSTFSIVGSSTFGHGVINIDNAGTLKYDPQGASALISAGRPVFVGAGGGTIWYNQVASTTTGAIFFRNGAPPTPATPLVVKATAMPATDGWDNTRGATISQTAFVTAGVSSTGALTLAPSNGGMIKLATTLTGTTLSINGHVGGNIAADSTSSNIGRVTLGTSADNTNDQTLPITAAPVVFSDAVQVAASDMRSTRAFRRTMFDAALTLNPNAQVAFSGGMATASNRGDFLNIGTVGTTNLLTINAGAVAALETNARTVRSLAPSSTSVNVSSAGGVQVNEAVNIAAGGTLRILQTALPAGLLAATPHTINRNITGAGDGTGESTVAVGLPFRITQSTDGTGSVAMKSTAGLIVNGTGTNGLRLQGTAANLTDFLTKGMQQDDAALATNNPLNGATQVAMDRLAGVTGTGGTLTLALTDDGPMTVTSVPGGATTIKLGLDKVGTPVTTPNFILGAVVGDMAAWGGLVLKGGTTALAVDEKVQTLELLGTKLNIQDKNMVINSQVPTTGDLTKIRSKIALGDIYTDSTVGALPAKVTAVGYAEGNDPRIVGLGGVLEGQSFGAGSVILKYTYVADANLDGSVDGSDVALWAQNFTGALGPNPANPRVWTQGDWNYDGSVDGADVALWATNFTGALGGGGLGEVMAAAPAMVVEVPEPATLSLLGIGALGLLARRRRN